MNEHLNAAIVRSAYEAFANGDGAALAALIDDDITWHESTPGFEGDYHGRDQALALRQGRPGGGRDKDVPPPRRPGQ